MNNKINIYEQYIIINLFSEWCNTKEATEWRFLVDFQVNFGLFWFKINLILESFQCSGTFLFQIYLILQQFQCSGTFLFQIYLILE